MEFAISQQKIVQLPQNKKQTYWKKCRPQIWPSAVSLAMTLTLKFQGQILNLLYLSQKWLDCHVMKSKHIDWSQMWPSDLTLAMTLALYFQGQYGICYISTKSGPIVMKWKANISIEFDSHVTKGFNLGHDLDLWIFKPKFDLTFDHTHGLDQGYSWSNFEIAVSQNGRADWHWTKGDGIRSFMTMTMTIWWPRSGLRIYQIVIGVTADVGVLSTHLVIHLLWHLP